MKYYIRKILYFMTWVINFYLITRILIYIASNTIENIITSEIILNSIVIFGLIILVPILSTLLTTKIFNLIKDKINN